MKVIARTNFYHMKKFTLLLFIISCAISMFAQQNKPAEDNEIVWKYASNEALTGLSITGMTAPTEFSCAIYAPAQAYVGDQINKIRIGLYDSVKNLKIRIWKRLTAEPVYEQTIGDVEVTPTTQWQDFELTEPFKVTDEEPLYIGYTAIIEAQSSAIGIHGEVSPRANSFFLRQESYDWQDLSTQITPVCIQAYLSGDNAPKRCIDIAGENSIVAAPGQEVSLDLIFVNCGTSAANVVDIEYTVNGETNTLKSQNLTARSFDYKQFPITIKVPEELGYHKATFKVTKIDGRNNEYKGSDHEVTIAVVENPNKRVVVCEELTGNSCGYCPRGIEGLKLMYEKHPDTFLGIGIHLYSPSDPMYISNGTYSEISTKLDSAPKCMVNRNEELIGDPWTDIEDMYEKEAKKSPNMKVDMYVTPNEDNSQLEISTDLTFTNAIDYCNYRIAFVVLEDKVDRDQYGDPIFQFNAFAGTSGAMNGWGDRPESVAWSYDDVARGIYNYWGLYNSVPETVNANQIYRYTYTLDMPYVLNIENVRIAALIINAETKLIENAGIIKYADFGQTPPPVGIANTENDSQDVKVKTTEDGFELEMQGEDEAQVYLYTTSGILKYRANEKASVVKVPTDEKGIYIIRVVRGNHTTDIKVVK